MKKLLHTLFIGLLCFNISSQTPSTLATNLILKDVEPVWKTPNALRRVIDRQTELIGYIDTLNNVVIPCQFKEAFSFQNGYMFMQVYLPLKKISPQNVMENGALQMPTIKL